VATVRNAASAVPSANAAVTAKVAKPKA
jgi:hypothetical protein